jgi:cystathionine beta-lyase/cystathionine gamma-synthase
MELSYILNELGEERANYFGAVAPPIVQTSNFAFSTVAALRQAFSNEYDALLYSRGNNPTVNILRKKLAALDHAEDCLVFNSGAAAIFAAVLANVKSGDHILSVRNPYTWAQRMFEVVLPRFNITHTYIDGTKIENWQQNIMPNTAVIYLESPNSWTYDLQDLTQIANLAKQHHIITIIDNSYCTPIYQKPIDFGIDLTLQSATKYISGHSDVVAGALCGSKAIIQKIFNSEYMTIGSGIQPFNAWLLIRGLRTLPLRLQQITTTTHTLLQYFKAHPKVEKVYYPFDEDFAQLALAKQQMTGACGLLTIVVKANNVQQIENFCNALQHVLMAVSWGGYESLIIPKCAGMPQQHFNANNAEHRMLRIYVGQEDAAYLIADFEQAFTQIN